MIRRLTLFGSVAVVISIIVFAVYFFHPYFASAPGNTAAVSSTIDTAPSGQSETIIDVPTEPVPSLEKTYTNKTYRFSVKIPTDFAARELPADQNGGRAIVLESVDGEGVQIYITRDQGNHTTLTAADVRASIPDMKVLSEQDVNIGPNDKGVAFKSDNEAFGHNSREVWFYFRGNLYQISTYAHLDPLMKAMFQTWQFF